MKHHETVVALLTYYQSPLTLTTVEKLRGQGYERIILLCDGDSPIPRYNEIIIERTNGVVALPTPSDFEHLGVPFYFVKNHTSPTTAKLLRKLNCSVVLNTGTPRKITSELLSSVQFGVINCHPGKLPEYRGCSAVEWALHRNDEVHSTTHFMTEAYDEGPIISYSRLLTEGRTYHEIRTAMVAHQARHLVESLESVLERGAPPETYPPQGEGTSWKTIPESLVLSLVGRSF